MSDGNYSAAGKWGLDYLAADPELDRLQRYAQEMNARDPLGRKWMVKSRTTEQGEVKRFVDTEF